MRTLLIATLIAVPTASIAKPHGGHHRHSIPQSGVVDLVTRSARAHGVPPRLAHGIVRIESGYNCGAKNPSSSATGIMQTLVTTARSVGVRGNLRSCATGLEAGMRYLRQAYVAARGSMCGAATLFNRGIGAAPVSSGYCRKVLAAI